MYHNWTRWCCVGDLALPTKPADFRASVTTIYDSRVLVRHSSAEQTVPAIYSFVENVCFSNRPSDLARKKNLTTQYSELTWALSNIISQSQIHNYDLSISAATFLAPRINPVPAGRHRSHEPPHAAPARPSSCPPSLRRHSSALCGRCQRCVETNLLRTLEPEKPGQELHRPRDNYGGAKCHGHH